MRNETATPRRNAAAVMGASKTTSWQKQPDSEASESRFECTAEVTCPEQIGQVLRQGSPEVTSKVKFQPYHCLETERTTYPLSGLGNEDQNRKAHL